MFKKFLLFALILGLALYTWQNYGYLLQSIKNNPKPSEVSLEPTTLPAQAQSDDSLSFLRLEPGYSISYYAGDVPGARSLAQGSNNVTYVGTRSQGVVYALEDKDGDGRAESRYVVDSGLDSPNGVVYVGGTLYVAEIGRIIKYPRIDETYTKKPKAEVVYADLPKDEHHGWRYMALGPDNKLYLGIGAPCNVCEVSDPYGSIARLNLDGSDFEIVARGVRNTVGFDWNPEDQSLWFTDNGRDQMGDDVPKDELNQLRSEGEHFGFPYCHAGDVLDPRYGKDLSAQAGKKCSDYASPSLPLAPHAAALGMKFIGDQILIAEHGSWNRQDPIGYRVMSVDMINGIASNYRVLVDGWLGEDGNAKGRPVDILQLPDESILISDDLSGAVYRLIKN